MTRIPYPKSVPAEVQAILDARPKRNVFRMLAHAPALVPGLMELTGAILYRAKLDPVSRELAILRVGHLCGSHYEVAQHRKIAAAVGFTPERVEGALSGFDENLFSKKELLVLQLSEQVVRKTRADDALFTATVAEFGAEQAMELLVIIGTYVMLAQVLENTGVELEEGGGPAQADVQKIFGDQAKK